MAVTVGIHKDQFYIEKEYSASNKMPSDENGEKVSPAEISLIGNQEIRQDFIARESEITKVMIDFKAWEQKNGTGTIGASSFFLTRLFIFKKIYDINKKNDYIILQKNKYL